MVTKKQALAKREIGSKYDVKEILRVLEVYKSAGYNCLEAEKLTGIARQTIRKWANKYSIDEQRKIELAKIQEEVTREMAKANVDYVSTAQNIRMRVLQKLETIVENTKDVYKLIAVGKLVNEILSDQNGVIKPTVNYFNQINETLLIQNNETKT